MPTGDQTKVACRTPTPGRQGVTNIPQWRFDMIREAILQVLSTGEERFADVPALVAARLSDKDRGRIGSVGWNVTVVKLEMEVRGEIARAKGPGPQRLILTGKVPR